MMRLHPQIYSFSEQPHPRSCTTSQASSSQTPLTSWMMLSDADCTLGFLAGDATGSTCALKLTS